MPLRIRKSVKIAPGLRINAGKRGASLSIGGRGNSLNIGKRGVRHTVGIPGTGISYTTGTRKTKKQNQSSGCGTTLILLALPLTYIILNLLL